jgi:hypothetical protein
MDANGIIKSSCRDPSGDLALLQDDDGRAFIANGNWKRNALVPNLTDDFQNTAGQPTLALPATKTGGYEGISLAREPRRENEGCEGVGSARCDSRLSIGSFIQKSNML